MYKLITPGECVDAVGQIDLGRLKGKGIKGIVLDLDNTIIPWDGKELSQEMSNWVKKVLAEEFKIAILSNNRKKRVANIAGLFSVPYVANAKKPLKSGFRKVIEIMSLNAGEIAIIGDQLFTDVLGGNRMGLYTIWVKPITSKEFITTRMNRKVENIAVRILKNKGLLK